MEPKRYAEGMSFPANWYGYILQTVVSVLMFGLDFFRGVMRPGLTLYMAILVTWIYWELEALAVTYGVKLDVAKVMTAMTMIINTIVYLFVTCFVWWFGDRNRQAPPKIG